MQLPAEVGAPLIEAANNAFIEGMHLVTAISVVVTFALAVFTATVIRRAGSHSGSGTEPELVSDADPAVETTLVDP